MSNPLAYSMTLLFAQTLQIPLLSIHMMSRASIFLSLFNFAISYKCFLMFCLCKSLLTFIIFLFPKIIFKKFLAKFNLQCITSNVHRISNFCRHKHLDKMGQYHSSALWRLEGHLRIKNNAVAMYSVLHHKAILYTWLVI